MSNKNLTPNTASGSESSLADHKMKAMNNSVESFNSALAPAAKLPSQQSKSNLAIANIDDMVDPDNTRTRSSYSLKMVNASHQRSLSRKRAELKNVADSASPIKGNDGDFLNDIELNGFRGIWNHHVTRCYFLLYLISIKRENLYVSHLINFSLMLSKN